MGERKSENVCGCIERQKLLQTRQKLLQTTREVTVTSHLHTHDFRAMFLEFMVWFLSLTENALELRK